jgi:hypothetical protein
MDADPLDDPDAPVLLETSDAARVLGLSLSHTRLLSDTGTLQCCARTRRGSRLFRLATVARVAREREAAARAADARHEGAAPALGARPPAVQR